MHKHESKGNQPPLCDLVPGYAFYSNIGEGLAENLTHGMEWIIQLIERARR